MEDIRTMKDLLAGLKSKKEKLVSDEKLFLRHAGINEEIEKAIQDKSQYQKDITAEKKKVADLNKKKSDAVSKTAKRIQDKMNAILPFGEAVFSLDDKLVIGLKVDDVTTPYNGLSGGERQIFDAALAHVLNANILILEAAELDDENLLKMLGDLATIEAQTIVNTCHSVSDIPENFTKIEI